VAKFFRSSGLDNQVLHGYAVIASEILAVEFAMNKSKQRIDVALVERGLASTRQRAQAMIMAGQVLINQQIARKPSDIVPADAHLSVTGVEAKYASRAGLKLEGALADFSMDATDRVCLDIGSSNGGFTDCLLQNGARRVYAVDVNTKQLDWKLQRDPRVHSIEKNARFVTPADLPELADIITVDVSFISVAKLLPALVALAQSHAEFLILIKPQFELAKNLVGKGGIVRDPALHQRAIDSIRAAAEKARLLVLGVRPSRVPGAEGNQEFFLHARRDSIQSSEPHARG
jgi:23S rRNA (cytidine1920-2'-O)/16S rRNA (cytidine1409-2'-O)-methyltransferase